MLANGYTDGLYYCKAVLLGGQKVQWAGPFADMAAAQAVATFLMQNLARTATVAAGVTLLDNGIGRVSIGPRTWRAPANPFGQGRWLVSELDFTDPSVYRECLLYGTGVSPVCLTNMGLREYLAANPPALLDPNCYGYFVEDACTPRPLDSKAPGLLWFGWGGRHGTDLTAPLAVTPCVPQPLSDPIFQGRSVAIPGGTVGYPTRGSNFVFPNPGIPFACSAGVAAFGRPYTPLPDDDGRSVGNFFVGVEIQYVQCDITTGVVTQNRADGTADGTLAGVLQLPSWQSLASKGEMPGQAFLASGPYPSRNQGGFNVDYPGPPTDPVASDTYAPCDQGVQLRLWEWTFRGVGTRDINEYPPSYFPAWGTLRFAGAPAYGPTAATPTSVAYQGFFWIQTTFRYRAVYVSRTAAGTGRKGTGGTLTYSDWQTPFTIGYCPARTQSIGVVTTAAYIKGFDAFTRDCSGYMGTSANFTPQLTPDSQNLPTRSGGYFAPTGHGPLYVSDPGGYKVGVSPMPNQTGMLVACYTHSGGRPKVGTSGICNGSPYDLFAPAPPDSLGGWKVVAVPGNECPLPLVGRGSGVQTTILARFKAFTNGSTSALESCMTLASYLTYVDTIRNGVDDWGIVQGKLGANWAYQWATCDDCIAGSPGLPVDDGDPNLQSVDPLGGNPTTGLVFSPAWEAGCGDLSSEATAGHALLLGGCALYIVTDRAAIDPVYVQAERTGTTLTGGPYDGCKAYWLLYATQGNGLALPNKGIIGWNDAITDGDTVTYTQPVYADGPFKLYINSHDTIPSLNPGPSLPPPAPTLVPTFQPSQPITFITFWDATGANPDAWTYVYDRPQLAA